jgi:hypothetical protein
LPQCEARNRRDTGAGNRRAAHIFIHYPERRRLPMRVKSFANFMLERRRGNPDLGSDAQSLVRPFLLPASGKRN